MKGMELPISTLIIVIIALIILLAILALFYGVWGTSIPGVTLESVKNSACQILTSTGCTANPITIKVNDFDANNDGNMVGGSAFNNWGDATNCNTGATSADNLASLCQCRYGRTIETECTSDICKCP